jgi:hypothetical protein
MKLKNAFIGPVNEYISENGLRDIVKPSSIVKIDI